MTQVGKDKLQDDTEKGSLEFLEQQAEDLEADILKPNDIKDLGEYKRMAAKVISKQRSMRTGLRAFAVI